MWISSVASNTLLGIFAESVPMGTSWSITNVAIRPASTRSTSNCRTHSNTSKIPKKPEGKPSWRVMRRLSRSLLKTPSRLAKIMRS